MSSSEASPTAAPPGPSSRTLPVLIVDDHPLLAQSAAIALRGRGLAASVAASTRRDRLVEEVRRRGPTLVLLDLDLGTGPTGLALIEPLRAAGARVLVVSGTGERMALVAAVEAGAVGWVHKSAPFAELVASVRAAAMGAQLAAADRQEVVDELRNHRHLLRQQAAALERLSPREAHVLGRLMAGHTAGEIAAEEFVSMATVRTQIRAVLVKLDATSQLAAIARARAAGFRPPNAPGSARSAAPRR